MLQELPYGLRGYFSCRRCPSVSCVVRKTSDTKKWVVQPMGFAKIPHTTVNIPFIQNGLLLLLEMPFVFRECPKDMITPKMGCVAFWLCKDTKNECEQAFFQKTLFFLLQEMPFGLNDRPLDFRSHEMGSLAYGICNDTPHCIEQAFFQKGLFLLEEMPFWVRSHS